jgi:D-alanyl-D-alanine carboxypeptidase/D-alanyl-D-alanine-endopeptidase (penicillin-binding protein 4)
VLRVIPGRSAGLAPEVRLDAPGYFQVESTITTTDGGEANVIAIQRDQGMTMQLLLRGAVPAGILGVSYRRRVESPLAFAAHAMVEALDRAGIRASGRVRVAAVSEPMPLLAARRSPPLAHLLSAMGKESDNFTAEMVLKVLGAERRRPGSSESGLEAVREVLAEAGVTSDRIELVNGSGLFNGNRVGAGHIVALLTHVYRDEAVRSEYVSHLAIAGVDGTLERRLTDLPAPRIVRAKTGTLNDVIALSGYVLGPEPSQALAFSVLVNGARGRQSAARQLADRVATVLAEHLHRRD